MKKKEIEVFINSMVCNDDGKAVPVPWSGFFMRTGDPYLILNEASIHGIIFMLMSQNLVLSLCYGIIF
jgi:hypothetical protein